MAIKNPRVAITIPEETKRLYERAGELLNTSASKCMASILIDATPAMQELVSILEKRSSPVETLVGLTKLVRNASGEIQEDLVDEIAAQKTGK